MRESIFKPTLIGNLSVRNAVVRAAATEARLDESGRIDASFERYYREMASSGLGVIITGMMAVSELDNHLVGMIPLYKQSGIDDLAKLVRIVHEEGGCIIPQLSAIGSQLTPSDYAATGRTDCISPSGIVESVFKTPSKAMTAADIERLIKDFAKAAKAAKDVGADGVEIQAAHGYLISHFLTPFYNTRTDEYGGSLENRARFLLDIVKHMREVVGPDFPIWVKLNCQDFMDTGNFTFADAKALLPMLQSAGVSAIEVSGGSASARINEGVIRMVSRLRTPMYFISYAKEMSELVSIPVGTVGGFRTMKELEDTYMNSKLAFVAMCRPFIREPRLLARWMEGRTEEALCISCNRCLQYAEGLHCIFDPARPVPQETSYILRGKRIEK